MPDTPRPATALPGILGNPARRRLFLLIVANGACQAATAVGVALFAHRGLDLATAPGPLDMTSALAIVGGFAAAALVLLWLRTVEWATGERLGQDYVTEARLRLFDHLNRVPSRVLQRRTRGVMMVRFVADLNALALWASRGLPRVAVAATAMLVAIAALAVIEPRLAWTVLAVLAPVTVAIAAAGPRLYARVREVRRRRGRLAANIGDKLGGASPVQIYARGGGERSRLRRHSEQLAVSTVALARLEALLRFLPSATVPVATGLILVVGADQLSAGSLLAAVLILGLLAAPSRDLARVFVYLHRFRAARDVLNGFLALSALEDGTEPLRVREGRIALNGVAVAGSIERVDAEVSPRELVVIAGPSGSGKSTLLALIARLFDPDRGEVTIDGRDVRDVELDSLRRSVSLLSADLPLLRGSLLRNLRYRAPDATDEEIGALMKLCDLEREVARLPNGLKTRVAEGGANLSTGLRQRAMLARAVLGDPEILLFDDVDAFTDPGAIEALDRVLRRRSATTLLVTNNAKHIGSADRVWRIIEGRLSTSVGNGAEHANVVAILPPTQRDPEQGWG